MPITEIKSNAHFMNALYRAADKLTVILITNNAFFVQYDKFPLLFPSVVFLKAKHRSGIVHMSTELPVFKIYKNGCLICDMPRANLSNVKNKIVKLLRKQPFDNLLEDTYDAQHDYSKLPTEIWELVLQHMEPKSISVLRCVSTDMKNTVDNYLEHQLKIVQNVFSMQSDAIAAFCKYFTAATSPFVLSGYKLLLSPEILHKMVIKGSKCPGFYNESIIDIVSLFYRKINYFEDNNAYKTNLLYSLALLSIVKTFPQVTLISLENSHRSWRVVLELNNAYIGRQGSTTLDARVKYVILMLLADLCFHSSTHFGEEKHNHSLRDELGVFLYGGKCIHESYVPKTIIDIKITGSKVVSSICDMFMTNPEGITLPPQEFCEDFVITVHISCRGASRKGCSRGTRLVIKVPEEE